MSEPFWVSNLILKVVAGSRAYGLERPGSDVDLRGVCIPSQQHLLGLTPFEQWEKNDENGDEVIYSLTKFVRLALACNPNIIEILYSDPRHVVFINKYGRRLVEKRELFLTKQVKDTFAGYAVSQLRRIERHHRWLVNPPDHQPRPDEYGAWPVEGRYKFPDHEAQRAYQAELKHWNHYQKWRRERNPARAKLERRHGYDTKHAMHLLRLLRMGMEIVEKGEVLVCRPDWDWLAAVRDGALTYEELLHTAVKYEAKLDQLVENSPLPAEPDFAAAEHLVMELQERFLWENRRA